MSEATLHPAAPARAAPLATTDAYALIFEAAPSGMLQVGPDGRIMLVNRPIEAMFQYDRADLLGQPVELLLPARFRAHHGALRGQFTAGASARPMGKDNHILGLRRDGSEFPVEVGLNSLMLGGSPCVVAAVLDVTAQTLVRQELERQRQELERSNTELAEFAHAASHDLKAPLRGMAHLAEWIAEDIADIASPATLENCTMLRARAARMQKLLDGLLTYAQVGRAANKPETFAIAPMVRELAASLALPHDFVVETTGNLAAITTERMSLERVLQNLIENAVKHHDRSSGHIVVTADREDGYARFAVSDDGPGILPRYHERIFQMFQTLVPRDDVEASGIGLAIVKKKVELHGGRITVESAPPERGTRFVFTWNEAAAV